MKKSHSVDPQSPRKMDVADFAKAMERLLIAVQSLSLARNLETIISIVRKEARELTGADGATFVLRDGDCCYYIDENAIAPLWKGKHFPMKLCISGWVMLNHQPAVIPDIYADPRIPADAYRPTFVKSLVMVPIRTQSPIGAIGNYWSKIYQPSIEEVKLLQALADSTSVAMENVQLYSSLEERIHEKEQLLKEVYHRVKNNLQVVSSLLKLQNKRADDPSIRKVLVESSTRIQSMAFVHEMLYQSENIAKISMRKYINNLFKYLYEIYGVNANRIKLTEDLDDIFLKVDDAIPCGLIINELISNSFKHAFPEDRSGEIKFSLKKQGGDAVLNVSDNGIGIPSHIVPESATSLGMRLIYNLTKQLAGSISLDRHQGTHFTLTFSNSK